MESTLLSESHHNALALLARMSLDEKLGQMNQLNGEYGQVSDSMADAVRSGHVGSIINEVDANTISQLQHVARTESRLGIPLLIGRDVIHGFHTIFPIPIGLACSWSETLLENVARLSAVEASSVGINWTFSPMIDVARDPRWGRVAESFGEDPLLTSRLGDAMIRGYQTHDLSSPTAIAACAKHFAGYGASESGRDYNTTNISDHEMRHVYLPPFKSASDCGALTFMTSFSDVNGVPVSANRRLLTDILKHEWGFSGFVVSDWASVEQLIDHGVAENRSDAAELAINAGVDMEMVSQTFIENATTLLKQGRLNEQQIDDAVTRILTAKYALGLFEQDADPIIDNHDSVATQLAYDAALQSCVLLKNADQILPLQKAGLQTVTVLGPLAHDDYEQLGTWIFDGDPEHSVTLYEGLTRALGEQVSVTHHPIFKNTRDTSQENLSIAFDYAAQSDAVILCVGEEAILSGEAHCRADIRLPGAQAALIDGLSQHLYASGKPLILVVMAGRPLELSDVVDKVDAILYAWHPGHQGGTAIADILLGQQSPSGKLPISFVRHGGQIPLYYSQKPTGRPVTQDNYAHMNDFPMRAPQTSLGMAASHMDTYFTPLFPFGFGLSYADIKYSSTKLSAQTVGAEESFSVSVCVTNTSDIAVTEIVQLYVRDKVSSVSRPVRELLDFARVELAAGESLDVSFELNATQLGFYDQNNQYVVEPGEFLFGIGSDSTCELSASLMLNRATP
ncbi:glycoside hydrolase family 3 N-terminal domain-containing protein [Alteromonas facilis]|uniref:glycoside hydrolase family 3 N-terminal domain-containing protein n=1 Tax=Alteromonas facilis TaxID=2048004 RepID=UPI000C2872B9|nr:glycoside hydrolase family 3 N-terminal domain-containing protein [Alteromonas facilis]